MPRVSKMFFRTAILFLIVGIAVGLEMAISGDHTVFPAHAHINLLGWVTSAVFGGYYALCPQKAERKIAMVHYFTYTLGLLIMLPALYMMLKTGNESIEPIVAVGSLIVAAGVLMFAIVVFSAETAKSGAGSPLATH